MLNLVQFHDSKEKRELRENNPESFPIIQALIPLAFKAFPFPSFVARPPLARARISPIFKFL